MNNDEQIHYILTDTLRFAPGEKLADRYDLFKDSSGEKNLDLANAKESDLVRWILSDDSYRWLLFSHLPTERVLCAFAEVKQPVVRDPLPSGIIPGDIDAMLVVDGGYNSIAIEAKVVKVTYGDNGKDKVNRWKVIQEGIQQANGLVRHYGFHQSYLLLLVKVDAVTNTENSIFFRGASGCSWETVVHELHGEHILDKEVGLLVVELVQPTTKSFRDMNGFNLRLAYPASCLSQHDILSNRIKDLHRMPSAMATSLVWAEEGLAH